MNFVDDWTDEENYKHINWNILGGYVLDMSLIVMEVKYGTIDADDYSSHSYYIIKISSSPYTLQLDFSSDGEVISSCEMVCKVDYFFPININYHYYVLQ